MQGRLQMFRNMRGAKQKLLASAVVLGLIGLLAGVGTFSAFSATTSNSGNSFTAGTVAIGDDDSNGAIFNMSGMKPGSTDSGCIEVTFTGSLASTVRLYGTTGGTGLDAHINVVVTRGTIASPSFDSCTGFSADSTDYIGGGNGVIYSGTLTAFADDYAGGLVDPKPATPESWTNNEKHVYKFDVTLADNDAAQGKTATQVFTWEARNS
jgi:predicted ribosomally synthesized peptide with SipW-like signal peptide